MVLYRGQYRKARRRIIAARGMAPNDLFWSLGIRPGGTALLELIGDFYVPRDAMEFDPDAELEPDIGDE